MTSIRKPTVNVASIPGPTPTIQNAAKEIKQPLRPSLPRISNTGAVVRRYFLNDSSLAIIAERCRIHGNHELEEITTVKNQKPVETMALIVVSYGYDASRFRAGQEALSRLDRADPKPGKKIFIEVSDQKHFEYLKDREWDYKFFTLTDSMKGLFQKEALWTIGTEFAFDDPKIQSVVLIDVDCAFHDNSWAYIIDKSLSKYEFIQPFAAILYGDQTDAGMNNGTIPSIAYCLNTKQTHPIAVPGGAYACNRNFFFNILGRSWPINPVGSGDIGLWEYLFGHTPIINNPTVKEIKQYGRFNSIPVGFSPLLLNHYYHGPMSNRMYRTRSYIANRCITGVESTVNKDGILEWSDNTVGRIMKNSMTDLAKSTKAYLSVNRTFTTLDTKNLFKKHCKNELGAIDASHHLKIVTVFKRNGIYTTQQVCALREEIKRTFKCPYKFYIVTDAEYTFGADETISCNIPSHLIPAGYEWVMASCVEPDPNTNILFISPGVKLTGTCDMACCETNTIYLSRIRGNWNTKMLYFKNLSFIRRAIYYDTEINECELEDLYPEPANYLIYKALLNNFKIRDILFHVDYDTPKKDQDKVTNFII